MSEVFRELLALASGPTDPAPPLLPAERLAGTGSPGVQLLELLGLRNGFTALGGALHVRPARTCGRVPGLFDWNEPARWRDAYGGLVPDVAFFAEDAFGGQFGFDEAGVHRFDPETAATEPFARDLAGWALRVLADRQAVGEVPARRWQAEHGPIPAGQRLVPLRLFVLGGSREPGNLLALDATEGLRLRAEIARLLAGLPEGVRRRRVAGG